MGQFECESVQFERVKPFSQPFWLEGLTPTGTIAQGQHHGGPTSSVNVSVISNHVRLALHAWLL